MIRYATVLLALFVFAPSTIAASSIAVPLELRGSRASMERQNLVAKQNGATFAKSFDDIDRMIESGELVPLTGNAYYELLGNLSSPTARPEVRVFIERLAKEYFENTGEKLVVTSLTRPASNQPGNAHAMSIHPTGLAIDLRVSQKEASRTWLEKALLDKEAKGLLDATREYHPPHYHIALFPEAYMNHLESIKGADALQAALSGEAAATDVIEEDLVIMTAAQEVTTPARRSLWTFVTRLFGR